MNHQITEIRVGIGAYLAGHIYNNGYNKEPGYYARLFKATEIWEGYIDSDNFRWGGRTSRDSLLAETMEHPIPNGDWTQIEFNDIITQDLDVRQVISGQNDTDEAGYVIAVLQETIEIPLDPDDVFKYMEYQESHNAHYAAAALVSNGEGKLWLWYGPWDGAYLYPVESTHAIRGDFSNHGIQAWRFPERDQ